MTVYFFKFPLQPTLGGAEVYTLRLAQYLQQTDHKVKLFSSDAKLLRLFEKHQLAHKRLFLGWEPSSWKTLFLWPLTFWLAKYQLKKFLKNLDGQSIFFCQSLTDKLILTPLANRRQIKCFWLEFVNPGTWLTRNPLLPLYRILARSAKIITVSEFTKNQFQRLGLTSIDVIYPGVKIRAQRKSLSPVSFAHPPKNAAMPQGSARAPELTIGILSRLHPEKGVRQFLQNLSGTLRKWHNWKIIIAGEGEEMAKLEELRMAYDLEKQVSLLGLVTNLEDFFSQIAVLVYPSLAPESFGISALEAQSRGIPVVASRTGALPEIVSHGETGFLVNLDHPEEWGIYLEQLADSRRLLELGKTAGAKAQRFSEMKMFSDFKKLLGLTV